MHEHTPTSQTNDMQSEEKPLRCVIVDDSPSFVHAAARILRQQGIDIVGAVSTIAEALSCVDRLKPDVTVVDIHLGDESGFDLADQLADRQAPSRVVLTSTHGEAEFEDMIAASAALGFVPKVDLSADTVRRLLDAAIDTD